MKDDEGLMPVGRDIASKKAKHRESKRYRKKQKEIAKQFKAFKKLRVLLGPLEIVNQQDPTDSRFINMGDIPISVKYFFAIIAKSFPIKIVSFLL